VSISYSTGEVAGKGHMAQVVQLVRVQKDHLNVLYSIYIYIFHGFSWTDPEVARKKYENGVFGYSNWASQQQKNIWG